jgi:hypothetical protein
VDINLLDVMSKSAPCHSLQSGVTTSQSCKSSTQPLPESAQCSQMIPFDRVGTLTCRTFQAHPSLSLQHVKGHQDRATNFWNLPLESQLNIHTDKLYGWWSGCQLVKENQVILSNHRRRIRTRRGKIDDIHPGKTSNICESNLNY